jgi:hypothetical protein
MDNKSQIVCEFAFLEKFINSLSGVDLLTFLESREFFKQQLFELIFFKSMVYINISNQEITSSNNPYIKKLYRQGNIKSILTSKEYLKPSSIYLINKDKKFNIF